MTIREDTLLIRYAVHQALEKAGRPLTVREVCEDPEVASLGFDRAWISQRMLEMSDLKPQREHHLVKRYVGSSKALCTYELPQRTKEPKVNAVKSEPDFSFNPVEFVSEVAPPTSAPTATPAPTPQPYIAEATAKSIAIAVGGVRITIDFAG